MASTSSSQDVDMVNGEDGHGYRWDEAYITDIEEQASGSTATVEWPELKHIIKCRLNYNISKYLTRTPRSKPIALAPAASIDSFATETNGEMTIDMALSPSTPGGLIIPPFGRKPYRDRDDVMVSGPAPSLRGPIGNGGQPEFNVEEDAAIGGKTLKDTLNAQEAREMRDRIFRLLDNFEDDPPFTLQRLCELALHPYNNHKALGKYLRAIERIVSVTTFWEPPTAYESAVAGPSSSQPVPDTQRSSYYSPANSPSRTTTPLFSPITFSRNLPLDNQDSGGDGIGDDDASGMGQLEGSPLEGHGSTSAQGVSLSPESPTRQPQPQEGEGSTLNGGHHLQEHPSPLALGLSSSAMAATHSEPSSLDIAHEPFVGRVDELDSGPLPLSTSTPSASFSTSSSIEASSSDSDPHALHTGNVNGIYQEGTGEGGRMTAHGISDTPQAISSTTNLSPENLRRVASSGGGSSSTSTTPDALSPTSQRKLAPLPRSSSVGSLNDRFVKSEVITPDVAVEVEGSSGGEASGGLVRHDGSGDIVMGGVEAFASSSSAEETRPEGTGTGETAAGSEEVDELPPTKTRKIE